MKTHRITLKYREKENSCGCLHEGEIREFKVQIYSFTVLKIYWAENKLTPNGFANEEQSRDSETVC